MDLKGPSRTFEDSWVPIISRGSTIGSDMPSALGLVMIFDPLVESRSWMDRNLKFGPNCDLEVDDLEKYIFLTNYPPPDHNLSQILNKPGGTVQKSVQLCTCSCVFVYLTIQNIIPWIIGFSKI